jgi:hypothetical protein
MRLVQNHTLKARENLHAVMLTVACYSGFVRHGARMLKAYCCLEESRARFVRQIASEVC